MDTESGWSQFAFEDGEFPNSDEIQEWISTQWWSGWTTCELPHRIGLYTKQITWIKSADSKWLSKYSNSNLRCLNEDNWPFDFLCRVWILRCRVLSSPGGMRCHSNGLPSTGSVQTSFLVAFCLSTIGRLHWLPCTRLLCLWLFVLLSNIVNSSSSSVPPEASFSLSCVRYPSRAQ